jgi:hypothetical protein
MSWVKMRDERDEFEVEFAPRLSEGESLAGGAVAVGEISPGGEDRTEEFVDGAPSVQGSAVRFRLRAAADGEQLPATYAVAVRATTDADRTLRETVYLDVLPDP